MPNRTKPTTTGKNPCGTTCFHSFNCVILLYSLFHICLALWCACGCLRCTHAEWFGSRNFITHFFHLDCYCYCGCCRERGVGQKEDGKDGDEVKRLIGGRKSSYAIDIILQSHRYCGIAKKWRTAEFQHELQLKSVNHICCGYWLQHPSLTIKYCALWIETLWLFKWTMILLLLTLHR